LREHCKVIRVAAGMGLEEASAPGRCGK